MTFYEVIFTTKTSMGIASGSDQLILAMKYIEKAVPEIPHSQNCSGCKSNEKGTLYHEYELDKENYDKLIGQLKVNWQLPRKHNPKWTQTVNVYLSEV